MINIEGRIIEIGERLYSEAINSTPSIFDKRKWEGKVLEWAMKDEKFKTQLFRFIDVLPSLKSDFSVIKILKEYFSGEFLDLLGIFKLGAENIPERGLMAKAAARAIRTNVRRFAKQFIAGSSIEDAQEKLQSLRGNGYAISSYLLGETVVSDKEADRYIDMNLNLLDSLSPVYNRWPHSSTLDEDRNADIPKMNLSVKMSSVYSQIDPADWEGALKNTKDGLRRILRKAKTEGASFTCDMENYYLKDLTIAVFKSLLEEDEFKDFQFAGIAIQAYLRDAADDLKSLIEWTRKNRRILTIRLVKGAYWDYETVVNRQIGWPVPVFLTKDETDLNFEALTSVLLKNIDVVRPAIGTHNIRSIASAIAVTEELGLPVNSIEFQMLYGMAEPVRDVLQKMGYRVRVYSPIGELIPGMAYLIRRLLENTSNESFLRRSFVEKSSLQELMRTPERFTAADEYVSYTPPGGRDESRPSHLQGYGSFLNEPPTDFSRGDNRNRMLEALAAVRGGFNKKYPLYIGDKEILTEKEIISFNPADPDEIVGRVSSAAAREIEQAIAGAGRVRETWKGVSINERAEYLFKVADMMREERFELAALQIYEVGKSWKEADGDVSEAIDYLEYYGREMMRIGAGHYGNYPGEVNYYHYVPRGTGIVISPWNFPLAIPTGMITAAIVTGNCVIFKPSGLSPVTAWKLAEFFYKAGLPPGVLQYLPGPGSLIGDYLVSHADIDFITFTGSKDVGLRIMGLAGDTLPGQRSIKRVIAEMGGKNAVIVDETADLDEAIKGVIESGFGYQGQKCSACSRVIVTGDIYEEFFDRLKDAAESIRIGPPERPGNFMGPVIDASARRKIIEYIEVGKDEGTPHIVNAFNASGNFIGPVLFENIEPDAVIAQEEIFGPVISILKAEDIDSAIEIANSVEYALTGGIFSRSPVNIQKVRERMRAGNIYINRNITGALVGRQPFGGYGMSGIGSKAGGPEYLLQFMHPVCISENTLRKGFVPGT